MQWRLLLLALVTVPCIASASPITYTLTGIASGTLGTTTFTNAAVQFTEEADTADIVSHFDGFFYTNPGGSLVVNISGIGSSRFLGQVSFLSESDDPGLGIGTFGVIDPSTTAFYGIASAALEGYDLDTALSPTSGATNTNVIGTPLTDLDGDLRFTSFTSGVGSASTSVTPEPSTFALLGTGLLGIARTVSRRGHRHRP